MTKKGWAHWGFCCAIFENEEMENPAFACDTEPSGACNVSMVEVVRQEGVADSLHVFLESRVVCAALGEVSRKIFHRHSEVVCFAREFDPPEVGLGLRFVAILENEQIYARGANMRRRTTTLH